MWEMIRKKKLMLKTMRGSLDEDDTNEGDDEEEREFGS